MERTQNSPGKDPAKLSAGARLVLAVAAAAMLGAGVGGLLQKESEAEATWSWQWPAVNMYLSDYHGHGAYRTFDFTIGTWYGCWSWLWYPRSRIDIASPSAVYRSWGATGGPVTSWTSANTHLTYSNTPVVINSGLVSELCGQRDPGFFVCSDINLCLGWSVARAYGARNLAIVYQGGTSATCWIRANPFSSFNCYY